MTYAGDLTPHDAWEALENDGEAVLVDVRTPQEWQEVGIPDLTLLGRDVVLDTVQTAFGPNPDFLDGLAAAGLRPGDSRTIIFLCRSGVRSAAAARIATAAGLGPAYNVAEGYEGHAGPGWAAQGLPVQRWDGEVRS